MEETDDLSACSIQGATVSSSHTIASNLVTTEETAVMQLSLMCANKNARMQQPLKHHCLFIIHIQVTLYTHAAATEATHHSTVLGRII